MVVNFEGDGYVISFLFTRVFQASFLKLESQLTYLQFVFLAHENLNLPCDTLHQIISFHIQIIFLYTVFQETGLGSGVGGNFV